MAYLGKNYEREFHLDFLNYLAKLKNNGSIEELLLKRDYEYPSFIKKSEDAKTDSTQKWLGAKHYQIAETLLLSNTKR